MTLTERAAPRTRSQPGSAFLHPGRAPYVLSGALAFVATAVAALSLAWPSLLAGAEVTKGNLRGTALIMLCLGLPVLTTAMSLTARGSARGFVVWLGTLGYLLYQAVLFCFATPLNNLFLVYVAYLGLSLWGMVLLLRATDLRGFRTRLAVGTATRWVACFAVVVAVLNAVAWLVRIVPAVFSQDPASLLEGTGLLTNPVYIQDLAVWLPLLATAAFASWRRESWGILVTSAMLAMLVLEGIGVAADQWFGARADPTSGAASMSMVPVFAAIALVTAVPLLCSLRCLDRTPRQPAASYPTA